MANETTPSPSDPAPLRWDPDTQVCNQTWMYLFMKGEVATSFPDTKTVKMQQMAWWNAATTADVRRIDAEKMSIELHRFFKDAMKRPYEKKFAKGGFTAAIPELVSILIRADAVVPALAAAVDRVFHFKDERDA